jgi:hypothetical protein
MTVYSLKKKKDTEEHHIFEGEWTDNETPRHCSVEVHSICNKATRGESDFIGKSCMSEDGMRKAAAVLGRAVCGICVSHLYATPEE